MKAAIPTIRFAQRLTNSIQRGGGEADDQPLHLVVLNGLQSLHIGVALLARRPAIVTRNQLMFRGQGEVEAKNGRRNPKEPRQGRQKKIQPVGILPLHWQEVGI